MKAKRSPILGRCINLLAIFILALIVTGFPTQPVFAASLLNVDNGNPACSDTTGNPFCTIQAAINAANPGDTINIAAGTYAETLSLVDKNNIIIDGAGEGVTIIDAHSSLGYGWDLRASGGVLKDFTFVGPTAGTYGIKVSGIEPVPANGFTIENVTIQNSKKTGLDINGVNSLTITDVTVNNTISGAGIALTDVNDATLTNINTSGNAWGSIAIMTYGRYFPGGSDSVTLTNITSTEPIYTEVGNYSNPASPYPVTNFTASEFIYKVINLTDRPNHVYYTEAEAQATALAALFAHPDQSFVLNTTTGHYIVAPGMSIQAAVNAATSGNIIDITTGTHALASQVNLNKAGITLKGVNSPLIQVSGTGYRFLITASDVTIDGLKIEKTDKGGVQNIIGIQANNASILNNEIFGKFVIGEGDVARAMEMSGGISGLNVSGNTIHHLRQPAYINTPVLGTIANNYVYSTKGWVVDGGGVTFTGNTWGTGANVNVYDIAILSQPSSYYPDIVAMANANNGAVIEDQRVSPAVLSAVYVDAATSFTSDLGGHYHPYSNIMPALTRVVAGGTIHVAAGTYTETGQMVISKDMTMVGEDKLTTIIKPGQNTGTAGDARAWILVNAGVEFNLSNVTLDGSGKLIETAFLSHGTGVFENNIVKNMYYSKYVGRGVALYGGNMTIRNNSFSNIQRIGMYAALAGTTSAVFDGNTYVGKGPGDWLDYGVEVEAGAHAEIMNNTISDAVGVAASDGSTSAGLLLTTYFAPGTSMNAHNNILLNNTVGIAVGYSANDTSTTVATHNQFEGNEFGITTTGPTVTAASNWWGNASGPSHTSNPSGAGDAVSDNVNFTPWLCSGTDTSPEPGFQPSLLPNTTCTNINVEIAGDDRGTFPISSQGTLTQVPILEVNDGPVKLSSTASILGGQRSIYKVGGVNTSFSEIMGVPEGQLDTTYWFPWYNNGRDLDTQLRIGNASTSTATVQVFIGADEVTPDGGITLLKGQSTRLSYPGLNDGPVKVVSNVNIVAAERLIYKVGGVATSFTEVMGLPRKQLDRTYWLPWYNNIGLDTQLRIANASDQPATVTVTIGDVQYPSFNLAVGESTRKSFDSVNTGPVKIESTQDIVAAQRIIYKVGGVNTSFSEMMAFAADQLDTIYWFPRYNNGTELDTQFRLVNVSDTQDATVHIFVGENEVTPPTGITLSAGESERLSYTGVNGGLVRVESDIPIVVSERVIYKVKQVPTSFTELMGLPDTHRDTIYWLPWYNHSAVLDTQLRFGLP